jgi:choline dehydrogenase
MADFIIVGAGSAGCVLAARLSENPANKVVLIEAGPADKALEVKIPAAFSKLFHGKLDWDFYTEPDVSTGSRKMYWPRGKMLGGSSSLNAMMYVRGHKSDYDGWAQSGCRGWSYDDVLPIFKRSENFFGGSDAWHGSGGPLHVEQLRTPNPLTQAFLEASVAAGFPLNPDINGAEQDGVSQTPVNQHQGKRWSAADAFLRPAMARSNLEVMTGVLVRKVVISEGRATGVEIERNGRTEVISATREVVLAAGAIGSPQLMMLSGLGPGAHLAEHGIAVLHDMPGVGANLQDHLVAGATYACREPVSLASAESIPNLLRYLFGKKGPLTSNVAEALGFIRTREGLAAPDIELIFAPTYFMAHGAKNPPGHGFTIGCILLRPESRGRVALASADPTAKPLIQAGYLTSRNDLDTLVAGVKAVRRVAAAGPFDRWRGDEVWPGRDHETDQAIGDFIRTHSETLYHPVGTCRMGADADAVVGDQLRVRGVDGLRIADASVMPRIIGGHTHAPTVMIAEKAADLISGRA